MQGFQIVLCLKSLYNKRNQLFIQERNAPANVSVIGRYSVTGTKP
jgi:hypothetical protein